MNARQVTLGMILISSMGAWASAQTKPMAPNEQTDFSAEAEGADHPVPVPDEVIRVLEKDDIVQPALKAADPPVQTPPASWFSASRVHLARPAERDLVVMGEGPLAGANVITFWVFRKTGHGFELVLRASGHDLHIKRRRTNGYRDIETDSVTTAQVNTQLYRFDGTRYLAYKDKHP